jgi:hypothetical protein
MPVDWPYPDVWGMILYFDLYGNWNVNFNDVSELLGQKLRVFQSDEGFSPNASFMPYNYEGGPVNDTILESGFEFVEISVIPEPSSVALMGLAAAGLAFARRRKV